MHVRFCNPLFGFAQGRRGILKFFALRPISRPRRRCAARATVRGEILQPGLELAESPDFWSLSDQQLAQACRLIGEGRCSRAGPAIRGEAVRVSLVWRDKLAPRRPGDDAEERAAILAALRKRTIQILVKLAIAGPRAIPAR
jgi:hypothetical protein